jgi:hypothetical protein
VVDRWLDVGYGSCILARADCKSIMESSLAHFDRIRYELVGRDGGYTAKVADVCFIVPTVNPQDVTPHSEAFQAVIWHLLVSHQTLKVQQTKWESTR